MKLPYALLNASADPEGTLTALTWLKQFYAKYPTGAELAEALYQYRKENNLIVEQAEKRKKIKQLQEELNDADNGTPVDVPATGTKSAGPKKPTRPTTAT